MVDSLLGANQCNSNKIHLEDKEDSSLEELLLDRLEDLKVKMVLLEEELISHLVHTLNSTVLEAMECLSPLEEAILLVKCHKVIWEISLDNRSKALETNSSLSSNKDFLSLAKAFLDKASQDKDSLDKVSLGKDSLEKCLNTTLDLEDNKKTRTIKEATLR